MLNFKQLIHKFPRAKIHHCPAQDLSTIDNDTRECESRTRSTSRCGTRRKATQRSNFFFRRPCKNSCSACSVHFLVFFRYFFRVYILLCYAKKNTILISFYRTLIIECLVLVALIFFLEILLHSQHTSDSLSNYPFCLVCFYIPFRFQKSHLCNFSLITIELTSCYMCAIT